jgi:hypothetical protein
MNPARGSGAAEQKNQSGYQTTLEIQAGQITNQKTKPWVRDEIPGADLVE